MDVQLKELIESIKKDGVESAEQEAAKILQNAEAKAKEIIETGKKEAEQIKTKAGKDAAQFIATAEQTVKQASRDLVLAVQKELQTLFETIVKSEVAAASSVEVMEKAIVVLVQNWSSGASSELSVLIPEEQRDEIENVLKSKLAAEIKKGLEIKPVKSLAKGFMVGEKGGAAHYDFSSDGIAEVLSAYLNPRLADLVKESIS